MKSPRKRSADDELEKNKMQTARVRLKGALKDIIDPTDDEIEKDEEDRDKIMPIRGRPPKKIKSESTNQSFIMKLFDRSIDLARYNDNSPLYPICREWMINQPNMLRKTKTKPIPIPKRENSSVIKELIDSGKMTELTILPLPKNIEITRIPQLTPDQKKMNKDNINLDYNINKPLVSKDELLNEHRNRWVKIKKSWMEQSKVCDEKYSASLEILNAIGLK